MRTRRYLILAALCLCFSRASVSAAEKPTLKVMTRNMDAGTDLGLILAATDQPSFARATAETLAEVKASGIPARAARLAEEIADQKPDLIGLQEVTLWRTGPLSLEPAGASDVLYDQLDLLMSELAKRKLRYGVILVQNLYDLEAPVPSENLNLRMTDRNAILARTDLKQSEFDVFNLQTHRFATLLPIPLLGGITVLRGWESVDVVARGKRLRFMNTHLEGPIPGIPATVLIQLAQTQEMLAALKDMEPPVVLLGDLNSNAAPGADHTGAVEMVAGAGFKEVWSAIYPNDPGYTWPLFGQDQFRGAVFVPYERIDLVFARGLTPVSIQRLSLGGFWGQLASDHAGVVATLQLDQ